MKKKIIIHLFIVVFLLVFGVLLTNTLYAFSIKKEYVGTWSSTTEKITVRTEPKFMHFIFTEGKGDFSMTINEDKTVSGHIGKAFFYNAKLKSNGGIWPVKWSGIIYAVSCGEIGRIFDQDPLGKKKIEIWICPINEAGTMEVEIRYGTFPMGGFICRKVK